MSAAPDRLGEWKRHPLALPAEKARTSTPAPAAKTWGSSPVSATHWLLPPLKPPFALLQMQTPLCLPHRVVIEA